MTKDNLPNPRDFESTEAWFISLSHDQQTKVQFINLSGSLRYVEFKLRMVMDNYDLIEDPKVKVSKLLEVVKPHFSEEEYKCLELYKELSNTVPHGDFSEAIRKLREFVGRDRAAEVFGDDTVYERNFERDRTRKVPLQYQENLFASWLKFNKGNYIAAVENVVSRSEHLISKLREKLEREKPEITPISGDDIFRQLTELAESINKKNK